MNTSPPPESKEPRYPTAQLDQILFEIDQLLLEGQAIEKEKLSAAIKNLDNLLESLIPPPHTTKLEISSVIEDAESTLQLCEKTDTFSQKFKNWFKKL